jgi:hypothetical protein
MKQQYFSQKFQPLESMENNSKRGNTLNKVSAPRRSAGQLNLPPDLGRRHGGIMRIGRAVIIPAILALGVAGSVLAGAEISAPAVHVQTVKVQTTVAVAIPVVHYHA